MESGPDEVELDETDRRIIRELMKDGRASMTTVAERAHMSRARAYVAWNGYSAQR